MLSAAVVLSSLRVKIFRIITVLWAGNGSQLTLLSTLCKQLRVTSTGTIATTLVACDWICVHLAVEGKE